MTSLKPSAIEPPEAKAYRKREKLDGEALLAAIINGLNPSIQAAQYFKLYLRGNFFAGHLGKVLHQRAAIAYEDLGEDALDLVLGCFAWARIGMPPYEEPADFLREMGRATLGYVRAEQWLDPSELSSMGVVSGSLLALITNELAGSQQVFNVAAEHLTVCQNIEEGHVLYLDEHIVVVYHPVAAELMLAVRCWDCFWSTFPGVRETPVPLESWLRLRRIIQNYRGKPLYGEARTPQSKRLAQVLGVKLSPRSGLVTVESQKARGFG